MAKIEKKIAYRYSKALFYYLSRIDSFRKENYLELLLELKSFLSIWEASSDLRIALINPMFSRQERQKALSMIAASANMSEISTRFLVLVFEKDRIIFLPSIIEIFGEMVEDLHGNIKVQISTAKRVSSEEVVEIEHLVSNKISGTLEFSWSEDPSLIGGILVRYKDKVLDATVSSRIEKLKTTIVGEHGN